MIFFFTSTSSTYIEALVANIDTHFVLKNVGELGYFLGIEAHKLVVGLHLSESKYIACLLSKTHMSDANSCSTHMVVGYNFVVDNRDPFEDPTLYRNTIGALHYLTMTRLDVSFVANKLSQFLKTSTIRL